MIYIEASSGAVKRVGRCDAYATEFDLEAEEYVPLPKVCVMCVCCVYATTHVCLWGGATAFGLEAAGKPRQL